MRSNLTQRRDLCGQSRLRESHFAGTGARRGERWEYFRPPKQEKMLFKNGVILSRLLKSLFLRCLENFSLASGARPEPLQCLFSLENIVIYLENIV